MLSGKERVDHAEKGGWNLQCSGSVNGIAFRLHVATIIYGKVRKVRMLVQGQNKEGDFSPEEKSLHEIISPALSELDSYSNEVCRYLISLAKNGSLEQHQTRGGLTELAEKLLQMMEGR